MAGDGSGARVDQDMNSVMQDLVGGSSLDIANMTSRDLMHWLIDQNFLSILEDFMDVSGPYLYQMREAIDDWLKQDKPRKAFPIPIGGEGEATNKVNSLRSPGYKLLERYPIEPDHKVPQKEQRKQELNGHKLDHLLKWKRTVNILQACHKDAALWYERWGTLLTVFVVALNAVVSSAMFSSISETDGHGYETTIRVVAACLSITSGVAAAVRSALRFETISEQHSSAARRFGKLYVRFNDMYVMLQIEYSQGDQKAAEWKDWFKDYMDVMEQAPMIKDSVYDVTAQSMQTREQGQKTREKTRGTEFVNGTEPQSEMGPPQGTGQNSKIVPVAS
eukprot:TRINITY_DN38177_c0_g1_i1.p1 TRINITY_DN38177_c0_g1~~TRINITY_DN38177_c0_g1_i1.p1  ORF type:complete len:367 (-),score=49.76 TRINITY_DN38177_c0_g1_i1:224-1225(-)